MKKRCVARGLSSHLWVSICKHNFKNLLKFTRTNDLVALQQKYYLLIEVLLQLVIRYFCGKILKEQELLAEEVVVGPER